jgi:hypothetical protein
MPVRVLLLVLLLGMVAGCGPNAEVRTYPVPKPVEVSLPELTGDFQILGAMFPDDEPQWFFKFGGKITELAPHAAAFEKMLASVRFPNGLKQQPLWDTPMGWEVGGARGEFVAATVYPDPKNKQLEISLSSARGGAFSNMKRWAGQLGQDAYTPGHFQKFSKPIPAEKIVGTWVDIRGPKAPPLPGKGPMMMGKPHP